MTLRPKLQTFSSRHHKLSLNLEPFEIATHELARHVTRHEHAVYALALTDRDLHDRIQISVISKVPGTQVLGVVDTKTSAGGVYP